MLTRAGIERAVFVLLMVALLVAAASCGPSTAAQPGSTRGELEGTITVSGAWALYPMMVSWAEQYQKLNPKVKIEISAGGAGRGLSDTLAGAVDIGMVSRAITSEEEGKGVYWFPVVADAVFPDINEKNPVLEELHARGITRDQFVGMFITGEIITWGQLVGRSEVTDPIHVFTRSDTCGAAETWAEYLGNKRQEDLKGVAVYGDPGLAEAVIKDPLGIGYNNLNYAFDMDTGAPVSGIVVVPIDLNGNGEADPEEIYDTKTRAVQAVATGAYPAPPARNLNLVTRGSPAGLTRAFIDWILDSSGGQRLVREAGYVQLAPETLTVSQAKLD